MKVSFRSRSAALPLRLLTTFRLHSPPSPGDGILPTSKILYISREFTKQVRMALLIKRPRRAMFVPKPQAKFPSTT